jgi:hypothetical protein
MKFPNFNMNKSFTARALVLLAGLLLMAASISAQNAPQASTQVEQCRNGAVASPQQCTGSTWQTGNAGSSNSHWAETNFLSYRGVIAGLTPGTSYSFTVEYAILQSGKHAIDYLGTYNASETTADPCDGGTLCVLASPTSTIAVPTDTVTVTNNINPFTNSPIIQQPGHFTMWGGTFTGIAYENYAGGELRDITVTFTANASTVVWAVGGHIAYGGDWGAGNSAGGISGSPYHLYYNSCTFSCQNHENSLSASAVLISGILNIVKVANTIDATGVAITQFPFSATGPFGQSSFTITDNVAGSGGGTVQSAAITSFGSANNITVTEDLIGGWTLADVSCTNNVASSTATSLANRNAVITTNEGGVTTCTFTNSQLGSTAAPANVSGRVTNAFGNGISGVSVSLNDLSSGKIRTALTNSFGYYTFINCKTEDFYLMSVSSKKYKFQSAQQTFTLQGDLLDLNFVANP